MTPEYGCFYTLRDCVLIAYVHETPHRDVERPYHGCLYDENLKVAHSDMSWTTEGRYRDATSESKWDLMEKIEVKGTYDPGRKVIDITGIPAKELNSESEDERRRGL